MDVRKLKILMICAHPGDAIDNSGGTLCHHIDRGDEVTILLITSGARSHATLFTDEKRKPKGQRDEAKASMTVQEIEECKDRELVEAAKELGITDVRFLHQPDDILLVKEELIIKIADFIRQEKPDILITHHPLQEGGLLTTHPIVGQIAMLGWEVAGARLTKDEKMPPHQISQVFFVGMVNGRPWLTSHIYHPEWQIFVDITDVVDRKVKALDHLESQHYDAAYARKRAEAVDGWIGTRVDVPYAESFIPMIPEVHKYLPIMQSTLDTKKDHTSRVLRLSKMIPHTIPYKGKIIV